MIVKLKAILGRRNPKVRNENKIVDFDETLLYNLNSQFLKQYGCYYDKLVNIYHNENRTIDLQSLQNQLIKDGLVKLKIGKANAEDVMANGTIRRVHTSEREAQKLGYTNAKAEVIKDLGKTTTGKAKDEEAATVIKERKEGNELPLNKEKDKKYKLN